MKIATIGAISCAIGALNSKKIMLSRLAKKSKNYRENISTDWETNGFRINHSRPNYVCSENNILMGDYHKMDSIFYNNSLTDARVLELVEKSIEKIENIFIEKIEKRKNHTYYHAECKIGKFNFVDDLEIIVDFVGKNIKFKSSSRVGYSDMGVNKKRIMDLVKNMRSVGLFLPV